MPQMAPSMWIIMLLTTSIIILMLSIYNYFFKSNSIENNKMIKLVMIKSWLW